MRIGKIIGSEIISDRLSRIYYVVDHFRRTTLGLSQIPLDNNGGLLRMLNIPHTYLMSSAFIPRPEDWSNQIGNWH
jgi:hypothetical protein